MGGGRGGASDSNAKATKAPLEEQRADLKTESTSREDANASANCVEGNGAWRGKDWMRTGGCFTVFLLHGLVSLLAKHGLMIKASL